MVITFKVHNKETRKSSVPGKWQQSGMSVVNFEHTHYSSHWPIIFISDLEHMEFCLDTDQLTLLVRSQE